MYKSSICDKKNSDISETKQSRTKVTTECLQVLVRNLMTLGELWPTFPGSKIFPQVISRSATKFVPRYGSGQSKLITRIS